MLCNSFINYIFKSYNIRTKVLYVPIKKYIQNEYSETFKCNITIGLYNAKIIKQLIGSKNECGSSKDMKYEKESKE